MNNSNKQYLKRNYENTSNYPAAISFSSILGKSITRAEALSLLQKNIQTYQTFLSFPPEEQEKLLTFIEGNSGLKITYDSFFKKIFDPYAHPSRLEKFLSAILNQKVIIKSILPHEGSKLSAIGSLVIMDIVVELEDATIIDIEMQKIGYAFPGERSDCYIADFIMRQYNRVKSEKGKAFHFRDMRPVYLIILMESSSTEFQQVAPNYIHRKQVGYDSGAQINNLSNIVYISLDTFRQTVQNINTELDAWLTFLSSDNPSDIIKLITAFPEFKDYYQDIVNFRHNPKELIYMYSEALAILDRNTTQYMIDELKNDLEKVKAEYETLTIERTRLVTATANLAIENESLTTENVNLATQNENLATENINLATQNENLKKEIEFLKSQLTAKHN